MKQNESSSCLPDVIVVEILEWLPINSVSRFRFVAKTWTSLFKCPIFIENHRRKQVRRGNTNAMLLVRRRDMLSFHDLDSPELEVRPSLSTAFLNEILPLDKTTRPAFYLVGSCNGIVCLKYYDRYILWNPALCEFKPCCPMDFNGEWEMKAEGYGVASCNDFKVIVMHRFFGRNGMPKRNFVLVHVYSSRINSWRQIDDAPVSPLVRSNTYYIFLNGACHWVGTRTGCRTILSLDINSEIFKQLELPDCLRQMDMPYALPIVLNEHLLGLVKFQTWIVESNPVEVWGMKEYGVKESWAKMFVISCPLLALTLLPWKNDILFTVVNEPGLSSQMEPGLDEETNGQLASISLQTNEMKKFQVFGARYTMCVLIHEDSLISLN